MITDFRLTVFRAVAERLSFTKAAVDLLISQPAVTKHISELERQVGVPLFTRSGGSVSLTRHGRLMLDFANRILALYDTLNEAFAGDGNVPSGKIAIGASTTIAQYLLPGLLAAFRRRYPEIAVAMTTANTEKIEELVAAGKLDFGMIEGKAGGNALHYEHFMDDELVLVTSSANPSFREGEASLADLAGVPLVIRENGSGTLEILESALAGRGIGLRALNIEIQLDSTEAIKRYLQSSGAFAFVSIHAVLEELAQDRLRIVDVEGLEIRRSFSFVTAHGQHGRLASLFRQFCAAPHNRRL